MKLKKFNEFFDSEELRDNPENELMKLTGDMSYNFGKKIDYDFKTENIANFITKISDVHYPFMRAFSDATMEDGGEIKFNNFSVFTRYDEEEGYYNFTAKSDDYFLVLGLKINSMNDYDVYVYIDDVRNKEEVFSAVQSLPKEFQKIDILINNAGNAHGLSTIQDGSIDDWDAMIDINVKGLLYVSKAILPQMVERNDGFIVNIGSIAGKEVYPSGNVYCASKYAVNALNLSLIHI